jgi:probable HAF family extracellular repeat protein
MEVAMTHRSRLIWLAILLTSPIVAFTKDPDYTIHELDMPPGGITGEALAINARGQIAGNVFVGLPRVYVPVIWDKGSVIELPSPPAPPPYFTYDINNRGQVVGTIGRLGMFAGLLWDDGTVIELGPPSGGVAEAHAINERGQIVGVGSIALGPYEIHALLWENDAIVDLGTLPGDSNSEALGINNSGQIVGTSYIDGFRQMGRPFLWDKGTMSELPGLDGEKAEALDINDRGQVVGYSGPLPVMWENGTRIPLETLAPLTSGRALGINNKGQVVGFLQSPGSESHVPVLWENGKAMVLPMLPPHPDFPNDYIATDINNSGTIVGYHAQLGLRPLVWVRNARSRD